MKRYEQLAVAFASALVAGDFERAHELMVPTLREELSPAALRAELYGMFEGYAAGPPTDIDFRDEVSFEDWPDKRPGDVGWIYVSIWGPDFVEAVTVIVASVDGRLAIRSIEWGRP